MSREIRRGDAPGVCLTLAPEQRIVRMLKQDALQGHARALSFANAPPLAADGEGDVRLRQFLKLWRAGDAASNPQFSIQALIDEMPDYLWVKDTGGRFVVANRALAKDNGRASAGEMIGLTDFDLHAPEAASGFFEIEQKIVRSGRPMVDFEESIVDAGGAVKWFSSTKMPLRDENDAIIGLIGISRDITDRKRLDRLRSGEARILEMIATNAPLEEVLDSLMRVAEAQLDGVVCSTLLLDREGLRLRPGAAPSLPAALTRAIDGVMVGPQAGSCGTAIHRRETVIVEDILSDPLWENCRDLVAPYGYRSCWSRPLLSHQGAPLGALAMYAKEARAPSGAETRLFEATARLAGIAIERRRAEERIAFMASHDGLTGLPNRALLKDRLHQAMLYAERYDRWATVAFIDIDNFKLVNDSLGHGAGDELLKIVASRMVNCVRATDTVVRLGANEFAVLLFDQPKSADLVTATLQQLREAVGAPVEISGHDLQVTCSIGLANYPKDGTEVDALLANAGSAMYRAKEMGRDNFQFYTPELNARIHEKFLLQEELRNAIAREEFLLLYQPQVDLRTGRIFAVEALIRWRHPTLGIVPPGKFIPLAEESGLIVAIGDWVLRAACRQNKAWQDAGLGAINVSVNVSARQFKEKTWIGRVVAALKESGLEAKYLELELTESLIMQDVEQAIATMKQLQGLGVQLSIDDFGTGYSSLSALKSFPVARLKIDKSFVRDLPHDENDKAVAAAVISLGQKLNLRVIAEGVETDAQMASLRDNNCDEMQGYLFSKPAPADEIEGLISRGG
jgi:diguanylate cyclase (GGDEF)-like protein/PAS domain S-box-containing protein